MRSSGTNVENSDLICNPLLRLPKSYEIVVTVMENVNDKYEDVKSWMWEKEIIRITTNVVCNKAAFQLANKDAIDAGK